MRKPIGSVLALLLLSSLSWAVPQKQATALEKEFDKLSSDYNKAVNDYYKPYDEAKTEEDRAKIKLDPAKSPDKLFAARAKTLADRTHANSALFAKAGTLALRLELATGNKSASDQLIADLLKVAINEPALGQSLYLFNQYDWTFMANDRSKAESWLLAKYDEVATKSSNRETKASALSAKAEIYAPAYGPMKDAEKGRALYAMLQDKYGDTPAGQHASGQLFRVDHLQIGMVAPDFTASDENGKEFRLSDYRGQVVVLDFWGFW